MTGAIGSSLILALTLVLAAAADENSWRSTQAKVAVCFDAMDRDPALAVVNARFARQPPTPAQLLDKTVPGEEEAEALRLRVKTTRPCRELRLAAVQAHHPDLEPAYRTLYYQADQVFDYLQQRAIDYGTANRLSASALAAFRQREKSYFDRSPVERAELAQEWSDGLARGHSNPPPPSPDLVCEWDDLNILCVSAETRDRK